MVGTWSDFLRSTSGFTGFDHVRNQVPIPVNILYCCLFLKWTQSFFKFVHLVVWIVAQLSVDTCNSTNFGILFFIKDMKTYWITYKHINIWNYELYNLITMIAHQWKYCLFYKKQNISIVLTFSTQNLQQ